MAARRPTSPPSTMATPRSRPSSRAARCARFACTQRALGGHSEGTQRAPRGHAVAIRGTQWPLRGHSEGPQRHAEAIRGDPRALRGTQRPSKGTQRPSLAIRSNQEQSAALRGHSRGHRDPRRPQGPHRVLSTCARACACACVRSTCRLQRRLRASLAIFWHLSASLGSQQRWRTRRSKTLSLLQLLPRASISPALPRHRQPHVSSDGETGSKRLLLGRATLCPKVPLIACDCL